MSQMNREYLHVDDSLDGDPRIVEGKNALYFSKQKIWDTEMAKVFDNI